MMCLALEAVEDGMSSESNPRYDELPYESHPYEQSHPNWLATVATLFGMTPPPPDSARILELGCAGGGNLIPMAETLPNSTCLGIELSARQVKDGQALILATGLRNVELRQASILDIDDSYGEFDYIIAHGVYSWVDRNVQKRILELCGKLLTKNGVGCISYNTYPGWHMMGMLRDMMKFHASRFQEPAQQIAQARALLNVLAKTVPSQDNPYGMLLKQESAKLQHCSDWYIYHEQLETENDPVYFHEFIKRAEAENLQFLGESELAAMLTNQFSPEIQTALREVATNLVHTEQYMDFFRNRTFRNTLLCRKDIALKRKLGPQQLMPFNFSTALKPHNQFSNLRKPEPVHFERPGWPTIRVTDPVGKAAFLTMAAAWPEPLSLVELETQVRARLQLPPLHGQASTELADKLWLWFTNGVVAMTIAPRTCVNQPSDKPLGSVVARAMVAKGERIVSNLLHCLVKLGPFEATVLSLLDGTHDRPSLVDRLAQLASTDAILTKAIAGNTKPLPERLESCLATLADNALLRQ